MSKIKAYLSDMDKDKCKLADRAYTKAVAHQQPVGGMSGWQQDTPVARRLVAEAIAAFLPVLDSLAERA